MADPIQLTIIEKVTSMCREISHENNYYTDVREVNVGDVPVEQMTDFPCINVNATTTSYLNPQQNEAGKLMKTFVVLIECFINENEARVREENIIKFIADLERRFADDTIGGNTSLNQTASAFNVEGTALIAQPISTDIFDLESYKDVLGFAFTLEIKFRQKRNDVTKQY